MKVNKFGRAEILTPTQTISGHRTLAALERYLGVTELQKENAISMLDF